MSAKIAVGVDIGSQFIKVIVSEAGDNAKTKPKIIGIGIRESKGIRHGYITNIEELIPELKRALLEAEKTSGYKITEAQLGVGGIGLSGAIFSSSINLPEKENEVTKADIEKIKEECEINIPEQYRMNRDILHAVPLQYKIDGKIVLGKPIGMRGNKLELKMLFITCLSQHLEDFVEALGACGVAVADVAASPLASSLSALSKTQQIAGCVLINIGAETVCVSVFENGTPISLETFPIGGNDITNDIALGLKISIEDAERVKMARPETVPYPRKKLEEIIGARLSDIFELVEAHLKKIGRNGLLPAGAILIGSGSNVPHIEELAKSYLKLPAKKACMKFDGESKYPVKEGSFAVAYGLTILGLHSKSGGGKGGIFGGSAMRKSFISRIKEISRELWQHIRKFLP